MNNRRSQRAHLPDRHGLLVLVAGLVAFNALACQAQQDLQRVPISQESLNQLDASVAHYVDADLAIGAELLVIQDNQVLLHRSHGYSDREEKTIWKNDTLCNIRSMTKPITSAAAQILVDRGRLDLDAPIANYLESFDNEKSKSITVRQVLTHRSGLPLTILIGPYQYKDLAAQVDAAGKRGPDFEPGSKFWYSDTGADVVGRLVEIVSGEKLDEFVESEILKPLGMSSTIYGYVEGDEKLALASSAYIGRPKKWNRFWKPGGKPLYPFAWGSQTLYSTTSDYAKFLTLLMNQGRVGDRRLLSPEAVKRMLEPVSPMNVLGADAPMPTGFRNMKPYYGQMMVTYLDLNQKDPTTEAPFIFGHSGSDGTNSWACPSLNLVIVYFTQTRGGRTPLDIEEEIDRLIIHAGEKAAADVIPPELQPLLGTYIANFATFEGEEFTVRYRNGHLILDVPSQMAFELKEPNKQGLRAFAIAPDKIQVGFQRNDKGEIEGLQIHQAGKVFDVPRQKKP